VILKGRWRSVGLEVGMNLSQNFELLLELTKKEIKVRYKNAFLGILWSLANPLAFAGVYYFVFKVVMRNRVDNFPLFLITGLFPWQWFANSIGLSTSVFISNKSLLKKTTLPKTILLLASILNGAVHLLISVPVIVLFLILLAGQWPSFIWIIGLPAIMFAQFLIILGLSLFVASLNVFFRDLQHLVGLLVWFLFWFTPIVYPYDSVPERIKPFVLINPMMPVVVSYRNLFLDGTFNVSYWALSMASGVVLVFLGRRFFNRFKWKFAELL
jgi:lipopolysaccharide transport system permease protein